MNAKEFNLFAEENGKLLNAPSILSADFSKMGYKERVKLYNENQSLYETLNGGNE